MLLNCIYWLVVKTLVKSKQEDQWAYTLLETCRELPAPQDHKLIEAITFQALKIGEQNTEILKILEWIGIQEVTSEYLLEKAGCIVAKLLQQKPFNETTPYLHFNFLDWLENQVEKYPTLVFTKYYYLKLCIKNGFSDKVQNHIQSFLRSKSKDFWAWELAAQTANEPELYLACLAKAVSLCTKEDMLVNVRFQLAKHFSKICQWSNATYEITKVIKTRTQNRWPVNQEIIGLQENIKIHTNKTLKPDYEQLSIAAESLVFDKTQTVMVSEINETHIRFLNDALQYSKIKCPFRFDLKPGDAAMVYYRNNLTHEYMIPVQIKKIHNSLSWVREIDTIIIPTPGGFAFSQEVYFPKSLLDKNQVKKGTKVKAKAVWAFDQKKEKYGWKAILIV